MRTTINSYQSGKVVSKGRLQIPAKKDCIEELILCDRTFSPAMQLGETLHVVHVKVDCMTPTLKPGDVLLVDSSTTDYVTDGIWAFTFGDGPIIVRVQRLERNLVLLIHDNKRYDNREIDLTNLPEGMRFLGRVVWAGGRI